MSDVAFRPLDSQVYPGVNITISGTTTPVQTGEWPPGPNAIMCWCDGDCYVAVGPGAIATNTSVKIPANFPVLLYLPEAQIPFRVSALDTTPGPNSFYAIPVNVS